MTEDHLREIFGQYGEIDDMDVPLSRQCKSCSRIAFTIFGLPQLLTVCPLQMEPTAALHISFT